MFDIQINPESFKDWAGLLELLNNSFAYMDKRIDPRSSLHRLDLDGIQSKANEENFLIAMHDDELAACAFFKPSGKAVYIGKVAVCNLYRRRGLARQLFAVIESMAIENNFEHLELQTRIELTENHRTFATLGFVKVGESAHRGYNRPTSITMRKKIK